MNMKLKEFTKEEVIEKIVLFILLIYTFCSIIINKKITNCISAYILLILDIYLLFKTRKNIFLFFIAIVFFYFNYSVVITKYTYPMASILESVYSQIQYDNTLCIGINSLLLFTIIIVLILGKIKPNNGKMETAQKSKIDIILLSIISIAILLILINSFWLKLISNTRQVYEYSLILFIIGFFLAKKHKYFRLILFVLMVLSLIYTLLMGGRVIVLQPIIAYVFINYADKIDYKKLLLIVVIGIISFTLFGLYGDIVQYDDNVTYEEITSQLSFDNVLDVFKNRRGALDTSVSAYWTGLTFIEMSNVNSVEERLQNFEEYCVYTLLGGKSDYIQLSELTISNYVHYFGGFITSYFYYWMGWLGVIFIAIFIGSCLRIINNMDKNSKNIYKMFTIYIMATIPRWYLYYPTPLFRGLIIFYIVYKIISIIRNEYIQKNKKEKIENEN